MLEVRNLKLGDGIPKICASITAENREGIIEEAEYLKMKKTDIIEWRYDYCKDYNFALIEDILMNIRAVIGETPLIFTFRTKKEGGMRVVSSEAYDILNETVASTGLVDFIDIEGISNGELAKTMITNVKNTGTKTIASYHNFAATPSEQEMTDILEKLKSLGADIVKMAVMPETDKDVDRLLKVTKEFNKKNPELPVVTMSMSELGVVSRLIGKHTGSAITFASVKNASAPGQIELKKMKKIVSDIDEYSPKENIYLIGFMGSGKTTVSNMLTKLTNMPQVDMDAFIVENQGMAIKDMFEKYGEEYFRDIESDAVVEISKTTGQIVSCGGGTVLREKNVQEMKKHGKIVLLTATPQTTYMRVKDSTERPVLNGNMSVEHISDLMEKRRECYENAASFTVSTDDKSVLDICMEIIKNS